MDATGLAEVAAYSGMSMSLIAIMGNIGALAHILERKQHEITFSSAILVANLLLSDTMFELILVPLVGSAASQEKTNWSDTRWKCDLIEAACNAIHCVRFLSLFMLLADQTLRTISKTTHDSVCSIPYLASVTSFVWTVGFGVLAGREAGTCWDGERCRLMTNPRGPATSYHFMWLTCIAPSSAVMGSAMTIGTVIWRQNRRPAASDSHEEEDDTSSSSSGSRRSSSPSSLGDSSSRQSLVRARTASRAPRPAVDDHDDDLRDGENHSDRVLNRENMRILQGLLFVMMLNFVCYSPMLIKGEYSIVSKSIIFYITQLAICVDPAVALMLITNREDPHKE